MKWSLKQGKKAEQFILRHWWTSVISRSRSWNQCFRNVVLGGDTVKDDSGSCAVFAEQGSSASQMTAAKVMDVKARLPGCARQVADAISAYIQVKMEDASALLKLTESEFPDMWIRPPKHKWPKSWSSTEDQSFLLSELFSVILWPDFYGKSNSRKFFQNTDGNKLRGRYKNWLGRNKNIDPMWKLLVKESDLGDPTSVLDHVYLGCTQRQCEISKDIVDNYRNMFESRISSGAKENLPETRAPG